MSAGEYGSAEIIDALNSLLESQVNSLFRFMGEGSPYLSRAGAGVKQPLGEMVLADRRRAAELANLIIELGGEPIRPAIQPQEQYLSYLTLKFLLPKLAIAKQLIIERYLNAERALQTAPSAARALIAAHLHQFREELATLERTGAELLKKKHS